MEAKQVETVVMSWKKPLYVHKRLRQEGKGGRSAQPAPATAHG